MDAELLCLPHFPGRVPHRIVRAGDHCGVWLFYLSSPITGNAFRIVLPNRNAASAGAENAAEAKPTAPIITPQMKTVLEYLKEYGEMRDEALQELLHIKKPEPIC